MKVPEIGVLTVTILLTMAGSAADFKNERNLRPTLACFLDNTPAGGKHRLPGITKNGDGYARTLLIHGARAVLRAVKIGRAPFGDGMRADGLARLMDRRDYNRASVTLANKMAHTAWRMISITDVFLKISLT